MENTFKNLSISSSSYNSRSWNSDSSSSSFEPMELKVSVDGPAPRPDGGRVVVGASTSSSDP